MRYRIRPRVVALFLLPPVMYFAYLSAKWGAAEVLAMPARNAMAIWEKAGHVTNDDQWERAADNLRKAYRLNPYNAAFALDLGILYEWKALQYQSWARDAHVNREKAVAYFYDAIKCRPNWGYAWANYAYSKMLNQQIDVDALKKAIVFAQWESATQRKVIVIGILLWDILDDETRAQLTSETRRAIELQPKKIIDIAYSMGWQKPLHPLLTRKNDIEYLERLTVAKTASK